MQAMTRLIDFWITVQCKILTRENIDEFPAIHQYFPFNNIFPIKIFRLVSYLYEMNE